MKVFILTTCMSPANLDKTLMVFKTLRVGFPTADVYVADNFSDSSVVPDIEDAATRAGAYFYRLLERTEHGKFIGGVLERHVQLGLTDPVVFIDTDMAFWANCEGIDIKGALFGGRFIPKIETPDGIHIARVHPSFFIVPDAKALMEACKDVADSGFQGINFKPFESCYYVDNDGRHVLVDTCSAVTGALGHRAYHFGPAELERYDHIFLGTIPDMVGIVPLHDDTRGVIAVGHELERVEDLKGLWRQQNGRNFEWTYYSGKVGHLGFMAAKFGDPLSGYSFSHVAIVNEETGRVIHAGPTTKHNGETFLFPGGRLSISVRDSCTAVEHGVAPLGEYGWSLHRSWPSASAVVSIDYDEVRMVAGCATDVWIDYETGLLPSRQGWLWASIRFSDGKKMMLYERSGRKELWDFCDGFVVPVEYERRGFLLMLEDRTLELRPVSPHQQVVDPFHSLTYQEALCRVYDGEKDLGFAYLEIVPDNWGDPALAASEADMHRRWAAGDDEAAALLGLLGEGSQLADDLADGDFTADELSGAVMKLMSDMIVRLPNNGFYARHRGVLEPVLMSSFLVWDATNDWAKSQKRETQMFAYTYREILGQVIGMVALLVGGLGFARRVTREVHLYYHSNRVESFEMWRKECGHG